MSVKGYLVELKDKCIDLCREILVNDVITSEFFIPSYARSRNLVLLAQVSQVPCRNEGVPCCPDFCLCHNHVFISCDWCCLVVFETLSTGNVTLHLGVRDVLKCLRGGEHKSDLQDTMWKQITPWPRRGLGMRQGVSGYFCLTLCRKKRALKCILFPAAIGVVTVGPYTSASPWNIPPKCSWCWEGSFPSVWPAGAALCLQAPT